MAVNGIRRSSDEYVRSFKRTGGICEAGDLGDGVMRFESLENMYVNYESADRALESIPGFRRLYDFGGRINGIFLHKTGENKEFFVVHSGKNLYRFNTSDMDRIGYLSPSPIATIKDVRSKAFAFGSDLYVMDGESIIIIDEYGAARSIDESDERIYVPTVYKNATLHEKRSIITDTAKEAYASIDPTYAIYGSPELEYMITDEKRRLCCIYSYTGTPTDIFIPTYHEIDGTYYRVCKISSLAFANCRTLTSVTMYRGVEEIEPYAFDSCINLRKILISSSVSVIGTEAFRACISLTQLHFNRFPLSLGTDCFKGISPRAVVKCSPNAINFESIVVGSGLDGINAVDAEEDTGIRIYVRLFSDISEILSVRFGGAEHEYEYVKYDGKQYLVIPLNDVSEGYGKEISVTVRLQEGSYDEALRAIVPLFDERISGIQALCECTLCEAFDGRVFLSGNPTLPGVVFHSASSKDGIIQPLYFNSESFFIDGEGTYPVTELLSLPNTLAVFKSSGNGLGSIFYHEKSSREAGTYPLSYTHGAIDAVGEARIFSGEALFFGKDGVSAIEKRSAGEYGKISNRSEGIRSLLSKESPDKLSFAEWQGYLAVGFGERVYLADPRGAYTFGGEKQYEWYLLNGVGTYDGGEDVFRYSDVVIDGMIAAQEPDAIVQETVISGYSPSGEEIFYVERGHERIAVYRTEERCGGTFRPATVLYGHSDLLFFGTEGGSLCVFNNDKVGKAPERLEGNPDFSKESYLSQMKDRLHPDFYSFDRRRVNYTLCTCPEDMEAFYYRKITPNAQYTLKFKQLSPCRVKIAVGNSEEGYSNLGCAVLGNPEFDDFDFNLLTFSPCKYAYVRFLEKSSKENERQLCLRSDEFCSPFGVYYAMFKYTIND